MKFKYFWFLVSILLFLYAFDALVLGIIQPVVDPSINTLTDRLARAFISIALAGGIIAFISKND